MRWKTFRRRHSMSAPRVIVTRHLPWPLRWAVIALVFGFSAAIGLWAFEFGKDIAGLDRDAKEELNRLRVEVQQLRIDRDKAQSIANSAESLLKAERAAQDRLARQLKELETDHLALKGDLGFFERMFPPTGSNGLAVRALHAEPRGPGQLRYQMMVMQNGKAVAEFNGRYELTLGGTMDGRPWSQAMPGGHKPLQLKQYARVEGVLQFPAQAVVKTVQVKVTDDTGGVRATQTVRL
ncbi:MAG: hypothetical protein JNJ42_09250 [Burkholderiaceae bacterium]|jgi:hypothetical protein|nr:hypothetical protein [Burkholderiaceae bacterium]